MDLNNFILSLLIVGYGLLGVSLNLERLSEFGIFLDLGVFATLVD